MRVIRVVMLTHGGQQVAESQYIPTGVTNPWGSAEIREPGKRRDGKSDTGIQFKSDKEVQFKLDVVVRLVVVCESGSGAAPLAVVVVRLKATNNLTLALRDRLGPVDFLPGWER